MIPIVAELLKAGLTTLGGAVLAKGKEVVEKELGVTLPSGEQPIDPETVIKLKQLEFEHEEALAQMQLEQLKLQQASESMAYADTASARDMNVKVNESASASWLSKNIAAILALTVVLGGGVLMAVTNEADVRASTSNIIVLVLGFYFGTSQSSRGKDATITALSQKASS